MASKKSRMSVKNRARRATSNVKKIFSILIKNNVQ